MSLTSSVSARQRPGHDLYHLRAGRAATPDLDPGQDRTGGGDCPDRRRAHLPHRDPLKQWVWSPQTVSLYVGTDTSRAKTWSKCRSGCLLNAKNFRHFFAFNFFGLHEIMLHRIPISYWSHACLFCFSSLRYFCSELHSHGQGRQEHIPDHRRERVSNPTTMHHIAFVALFRWSHCFVIYQCITSCLAIET